MNFTTIICHQTVKIRSQLDVHIVYNESIVVNKFTRDSRKALNILKETTNGNDTETWINLLKCGIKDIQ